MARRPVPHLEVLARAAPVFSEAVLDYDRLLRRIVEYTADATGDACTLRLLSEDGTHLEPVAGHHPDPELRAAIWASMQRTGEPATIRLWRPVMEERRTVRHVLEPGAVPVDASDAQIDFMRRFPVCSVLVTPLVARGRVLGGMLLVRYGERPPYTAEDETLLGDLAERAALALDNARLYRQAQEQAETFRAVIEYAPDIISRFDRELRHRYVNPAVERAMGLPASALIGKTNRELGMPEPLVGLWELTCRQVFATGREQTLEFAFPTPTGERHFHARLAPESAPDGSVRSVLAIARDVTDRKKAEFERTELYRELLAREQRMQELVGRIQLDRERDAATAAALVALQPLTFREKDVPRLLVEGHTNREIAHALGLGLGTVKNYVARVVTKLGASGRTGAATRAIQLGLVMPGGL